MQVVVARSGLHQVIATHEARRQPHAATGLHHQHRQIAAGAHPLLEGAASRPGGTAVPLGVLHPILNDLHQLLQEHQRPLVAAHQRFLGHIHRRRIVLTIGQPALQGPHQVAIEPTHRIGQLGFRLLQAALQRRSQLGFHQAGGNHLEAIAAAHEAGPHDLIPTGRHQRIEVIWHGADVQLKVDQPLEAMAARFQTEAMGTQQDRRAVVIIEGVGDAGTHAGTGLARGSCLGRWLMPGISR